MAIQYAICWQKHCLNYPTKKSPIRSKSRYGIFNARRKKSKFLRRILKIWIFSFLILWMLFSRQKLRFSNLKAHRCSAHSATDRNSCPFFSWDRLNLTKSFFRGLIIDLVKKHNSPIIDLLQNGDPEVSLVQNVCQQVNPDYLEVVLSARPEKTVSTARKKHQKLLYFIISGLPVQATPARNSGWKIDGKTRCHSGIQCLQMLGKSSNEN